MVPGLGANYCAVVTGADTIESSVRASGGNKAASGEMFPNYQINFVGMMLTYPTTNYQKPTNDGVLEESFSAN